MGSKATKNAGPVRLDKYVSSAASLSRKEASAAVRADRVCVGGVTAADPGARIDPASASVTLDGAPLYFKKFVYIMLNKPQGYVSSTDDPGAPTVLELLPPELRARGVFPCGRLDRYTTGLLILTDDGAAAHRLLAPKSHVAKTYEFTTRDPLGRTDELESGVHIAGGYLTKPCTVTPTGPRSGSITLTEGKYHQIKQMLEAVGNKIVTLRRVSFGGVALDPDLAPGAWRELSPAELRALDPGLAPDGRTG